MYKTNSLIKLWIQHLIWLIFCNILDCYRCIMFFVSCWLICREMFFCGRNKYGRNKEEYFAKSISIMDIVKFFRWLLKALKVFIIGVLEARVNHLKSIPRTNYSSYKSFFTYEIFYCTHFYMEWWIAFPLQYVIWRRYKEDLPRLRSIRF